MTASQKDSYLIYAQFAVLLAIVAIVDGLFVRVGLTLVVGLLLVQRAVRAPVDADAFQQRRNDPVTREAVGELLSRIRDFYAACHVAGTTQLPPDEAMAQADEIERDLTDLLGRVVRASRGTQMPAEAHG